MHLPSRKAYFSTCVIALITAASLLLLNDSKLPEYQGKTAEEWFYGEDGNPGSLETIENAKIAFEAIGTHSVPYLIGKLHERDTFLSKIYLKVYAKAPTTVRDHFKPPNQVSVNQVYALMHLASLPIQWLDPFVLDFIELFPLLNKNAYFHGFLPYGFIKGIVLRSPSTQIQNSFFESLLHHSDFMIRLDGAITLSKIKPDEHKGISILSDAITNRLSIVFDNSGSHKRLLPEMIDEMTTRKQKEAHEALIRVAPELAKQYPIHNP